MNDLIREKIRMLPSSPGVYKMLNAEGNVIYVGKAISLKNRVSQYFQSSKNHSPKVLAMVHQIEDFEYICVSNETEALSLECNLIKQIRPYYNILLKDDKHFPYLRVDFRQKYPQIEIVRRIKKDGAHYFGPYLSAIILRDNIQFIREYYPVRHCKKDIEKAIASRERPCLMYHIGKCCAPCSGNISSEEYKTMLHEICSFLEGNTDSVIKTLKSNMLQCSDNLEFEKAAAIRDRIKAIETLKEKQSVITTKGENADCFALGRLDANIVIFALFIRNGKVIGTEKFRMDASAEESDGEILSAFLAQYYSDEPPAVHEVLLYQDAEDRATIEKWLSSLADKRVAVLVPERGEKRHLTELAYRNCLDTLQKDASLQKRAWERGEGALAQLAAALNLSEIPVRIECYDNSHFQGRDTVSSMVVFESGQPEKSKYRRFRAQKDFDGDDIAAMYDTITRRLQRAKDQDQAFLPLPDLIIADGGKAQLNAVLEALHQFGLDYIPAIGLAETIEGIYLPESSEPILLPRNSASLHLIERIRDEAHRFAISYHRNLREKKMVYSILDDIPGIGEKRKHALYDAFTTIDQIREADVTALSAVPGMNHKAALAVYDFFHTVKDL